MDKEAVGMERRAVVTEEMMAAGARSLIDGQENRPGSSWADEALWCYEAMHALAQQPAVQAVGLTNEQFIAAHGERLAAMLGIKEWWDIADRDARIRATLLSRAAPTGEAKPVAWRYRERKDDRWRFTRHSPETFARPMPFVEPLYAAPHPSAQQAEQPAEEARPSGDAIARSKRILEAVDTYHERPNSINRHALRCILMDEFTELLAKGVEEERTVDALARLHYQTLFNAIAAATHVSAGAVSISVAKFRAAILARTASDLRAEGLTDAARDVLAERRRQVEEEGWTPEHDDRHREGEMAEAAAAYASESAAPHGGLPMCWPWAKEWWKPAYPRRNLVKAGALILAEIERLDRSAHVAQMKEGHGHG